MMQCVSSWFLNFNIFCPRFKDENSLKYAGIFCPITGKKRQEYLAVCIDITIDQVNQWVSSLHNVLFLDQTYMDVLQRKYTYSELKLFLKICPRTKDKTENGYVIIDTCKIAF